MNERSQLCEICAEHRAVVVHLSSVGEESRLCDRCLEMVVAHSAAPRFGAWQNDLTSPFTLNRTPLSMVVQLSDPVKKQSCPACGKGWAEFTKSETLGCPTCYATFSDTLSKIYGFLNRPGFTS
ncbi:hypothetical protein K8R78_07035 [bacterium]|nr:hypothetical protein [bacterium]